MHDDSAVEEVPLPKVEARPSSVRELSPRAIFAAMLIAAMIGASYPYVVMKLGYGPNVSVVSAIFGFLMCGFIFRDFHRWENNLIQTAGTSAGATAFLCVIMAAFDMLQADPTLGVVVAPTPWQTFWWLVTAGTLGVFLAVPMRKHFIVDEKLPYADGIAAAETLIVLDSTGKEARQTATSMGLGTAFSAVLMAVREDAHLLVKSLPEMTPIGATGAAMNFGVNWSVLPIGSGMLVGMRISISMLVGSLLSWYFIPPMLLEHGAIDELTRRKVLMWVMWPGTGLLISGGLTALFMRWRTLVNTFKSLSASSIESGDFPMRWVVIGSIVSAVALVIVQKWAFDMPVWMTVVAIVLSIPLMLVGLRVKGETNWGPISVMANMMQVVFGFVAPGHIVANMGASGVAGSVAIGSEELMQDFKTGHIIGSTPRYLTYVQLLAIPVGAAALSYVYPLLRATYGIGGQNGLQSPISQKWVGFAQLLSRGFGFLPKGAVAAMAVAAVLGVVLTVVDSTKFRRWSLSAAGLGMGMLLPASIVITMTFGAVLGYYWGQFHPKSHKQHLAPLASGFIAGEAIIAVIIPILVGVGLLHLK